MGQLFRLFLSYRRKLFERLANRSVANCPNNRYDIPLLGCGFLPERRVFPPDGFLVKDYSMARKTASRLDMRRMAEAAEARDLGDDGAEEKPKRARAKAKTAKKTTKRAKEKVAPRRMLMWAIYNGNMKEEARFSFAERELAEEKLGQLREKSTKKLFFIQPIKVPLGDATAVVPRADDLDTDDEPAVKRARRDEEE